MIFGTGIITKLHHTLRKSSSLFLSNQMKTHLGILLQQQQQQQQQLHQDNRQIMIKTVSTKKENVRKS